MRLLPHEVLCSQCHVPVLLPIYYCSTSFDRFQFVVFLKVVKTCFINLNIHLQWHPLQDYLGSNCFLNELAFFCISTSAAQYLLLQMLC